ncbi:cytochrome P450 [Xylaria palmicola]|nr:cytochrome P450 [Xylaria palmicola]
MIIIQPSTLKTLGIPLLLVAGVYLYHKLYFKRFIHNAHIPQLPSSLLWGHLVMFDKFTKRGVQDRHPDIIIDEMHRALGQPPVMLLDSWPIAPPMVVVASHEVAEQISRASNHLPYSVPKAPSAEGIANLIGRDSILVKHDEEWKAIRKRFNSGFAPRHLISLLPVILAKTMRYLDILDTFALTGQAFSLDRHTTNLTFDIIGAVAMDEDMKAQNIDQASQGELIRMFKDMITTYANDKLHLPWWLHPRVYLKRRQLGDRISHVLRDIVRRNFNDVKANRGSLTIVALSLQETDSLTPEVLEETCDQLKTFLFAGHDTTSTTIIWAIYELSRTPHALKATQDELDRLFGQKRNPNDVNEALLSSEGDKIIHQMTYISAVLREVLRLHPPAGSLRMPRDKTGFHVSTEQGDYNLNNNWIYINHYIIQRDKAIYGDNSDCFVPERWLEAENSIPASAWRPFERGPRNCIGQELANIEARVIIAMVIRRYEFVKVGLGEMDLNSHGRPTTDEETKQFKARSDLYSTIQITAKPVDGMMMKARLIQ